MKPGDLIIIYSGHHYGQEHRVVEIVGRTIVRAVSMNGNGMVSALVCDCELVEPAPAEQQEAA